VLFSDLLTNMREQVVTLLANLQVRMEAPPVPEMPSSMHKVHEDPALAALMSDDPAYDPAIRTAAAWPRCTARARGQGPRRSQRTLDLGQGLTQRALPPRLGQDVQALPRTGLERARQETRVA
jgi:hypothetical protein